MIGLHRLLGQASGQVLCGIVDVTDRQRAERALGELSGRLLHLRDEEQRRIARELHDSTAQNASALAMNLARVIDSGNGLTEDARALLVESRGLAEETARELRDLASVLHPPFLDEVGMLQAVRHHLDSFERRTGIKTTLAAPDDLERFPKEIEIAVFRIVQESLTNVQRHSGSATVRVLLEVEADHIRVAIRDKGHGFDIDGGFGGSRGSGVGVDGMRERAKLLGGQLSLRSGVGGTTVTAQIPIPEAP
jgi:signal transduction histidine kinase